MGQETPSVSTSTLCIMQTSTRIPSHPLFRWHRLGTVTMLLAGLWLALPAAAQVGIGTIAPDAKAALDIASTDKGLLVPRLTAAQRGAITTPPAGLLVYQTDGAQPGFWYYEATAGWTYLNPLGDNLGNHSASQNLKLNANWLSSDGDPEGVNISAAGRVGVGVPGHAAWKLTVGDTTNSTLMVRDLRANGVDQRGPHLGFVVGPTGAGYFGAYVDYIHSDATWPFRDNSLEIRSNGSAGNNGRINFFAGSRSNLTPGPHVTIRENGAIGVGINDPVKKLHLYSTNQYDGLRIQVAQGFGSGSVEYWSGAAGSSNVWRPGMIRATDNGTWTGGLAFFTNGTGQTHKTDSVEVMRLVNRRVGIGISNPSVALHVRDTASASQTIGYFEGNNPSYAGAYVNATKASAQPFWGYRRQGVIVGWHELSSNGDWNLILKNNAGGFMLPLTVSDTLGLVGIGTTAPRTRLALTPTTTEPKITLWDGGSTTSHYGFGVSGFQLNYHVNGTNDNHVFFAGGKNGDGTELVRIKGNGRVGIGTSNPQQNLHIYSGQRNVKLRLQGSNIAGGTYGAAGIEFWSDPQGTASEWRPAMIRSTDQAVGTYTGGLAFYVNGTSFSRRRDTVEVMRLVNRQVGIGTPTPGAFLHVRDTTGGNAVTAYFENASALYAGVYMNATKATARPYWGYQRQGAVVGWHEVAPNGDWNLVLPNTASTTITPLTVTDTTGRVGIGTTAPRTRLALTPTTAEAKITLWDGGSTTSHYGFGISGAQLNYHVNGASDNHVFYAGGKNGDGTELMRIKGNGKVGIGTNNPITPLHVVASSGFATVAQFEGSNASFAGTYVNASTAGAMPFYGYQQQGAIKGYHQINSTGDWQLTVNGGTRLTVDAATGNLGVGTTNPIAKLHINGGSSVSPTGSTYSFFNPGNTTLSTSTATTARTVAAYIEGGQFWVNSAIVAGALNTSSDRRIKQVVGVSDSHHDLDLLNQLRITDYRYIDQVNNTQQVVKKVIAQEVEEVLPAAVTRSRMAIPDVFEVAADVRYAAGVVTVRTTKAHGFQAGNQVRLYTEQQQDLNPTVAVVDAHTFTFTATEAPAARLFVYGKFVDDFRSVDYDALAMLNVSATQELARQLKALQERNAALEQRAATAEAVNQSFESRLRALEAGSGQARK